MGAPKAGLVINYLIGGDHVLYYGDVVRAGTLLYLYMYGGCCFNVMGAMSATDNDIASRRSCD